MFNIDRSIPPCRTVRHSKGSAIGSLILGGSSLLLLMWPSLSTAEVEEDVVTVHGGKCSDWGMISYGGGCISGEEALNIADRLRGDRDRRGRAERGDTTKPARTAKEQETQQNETDCRGNPVILSTGNKVEPELDFASEGEMGLFLRRVYNHHWTGTGLFGGHWLSNFDYSLVLSEDGALLWAQRPDGRRIKFIYSPTQGRWNEDKASPIAYAVIEPDGSYVLHNENRGVERYDADGYIVELKNEHGVGWTFSYINKYLRTVTHSSGRSVTFSWNSGQLASVTDPAGAVYRYSYTPDVFGTGRHRLASTTLPAEPVTTVSYHYEDSRFPGGLTGKSFNGVRYSTFFYDSQGRAISTEHAGGVERYTFSYVVEGDEQVTPPPAPPPPGGYEENGGGGSCEYRPGDGMVCFQPLLMPVAGAVDVSSAVITGSSAVTKSRPVKLHVTELSPLGKQSVYHYEDGRRTSLEGAGTLLCPASTSSIEYDANGYENIVTDFRDIRADFDYDEHGHLIKRTEALGTPAERTTHFTWDESNNRQTRVVTENDSQTDLAYAPDGRIGSVTVTNLSGRGTPNQTRTTAYTYTRHGNGLLASLVVNGPLPDAGDAIRYSYSVEGNLISVQNSLGHATVYSNHDAMGRPGRITGPNGDVVEHVYDARGRLAVSRSVVSGVASSTSFAYDGAGRLVSVQMPDGRLRTKVYDAAGRVTREYEQDAGGTYAQLRYTYNEASLPTSVVTERISVVVPPAGVPVLAVPASGPSGNYRVSWSLVPSADYYALDESSDGVTWGNLSTEGALFRDFNGRPAGSYYYRVAACNTAGCAAASPPHEVKVVYPPAAASAPSAPSPNATGSYLVSWLSIAGASSYQLEETANGGGSWSVIHNGAGTSRSVSGKVAGTYAYRVRACNEAGCGGDSGVSAVQVVAPSAAPTPVAPTQSTSGNYTVAWASVAYATSYQLEESVNGGSWILIHNASGTSKSISGKTAGAYGYRLKGCNAVGCGAASGATQVQVVVPATPLTPVAPVQSTSGSYTVAWTAVAYATSYQLEESVNGGAWVLIHNASGTSKTISGKTAGTYGYRLKACNAVGCGPVSAVASVVEVDPPTSAPTATAPAVNVSGAYTVSWTPVPSAASYQLEESAEGGSWGLIQNDGATSRWMSGKSTSTSYSYRVRACNAAGCGPTSASILVQKIIYGAQYMAQTIPAEIVPGQVVAVWVQMKNTGNTAWTPAESYRLGSQNAQDNVRWGLSRVTVPGTVAPGQTATFYFSITGPSASAGASSGMRAFQWQMVRDGVTWFGELTPNTGIWLQLPQQPDPCAGRPNCYEK